MPPRKIYFPGKVLKKEDLNVAADETGLHEIRDFVLRLSELVALRQQDAHNLRLAVDEAASNIYRHAYNHQPGKITVKATLFAKYLRLELIDQGTAFDW